jgi:hypothetical protein
MSIETAWIDAFCSSERAAKKACNVAALRPRAAHTIAPVA